MAQVAGCVVTSATRPSPIIHTLRPSCRLSRYSAPVRMIPPSQAHTPRPCGLGEPGLEIDNAHVSSAEEDRKSPCSFQGAAPSVLLPRAARAAGRSLRLVHGTQVVIALPRYGISAIDLTCRIA